MKVSAAPYNGRSFAQHGLRNAGQLVRLDPLLDMADFGWELAIPRSVDRSGSTSRDWDLVVRLPA